MSHLSVKPPIRPVWTPADARALRDLADSEPVVIGQSVVLDLITECEHLR